MTSRVWQRLFCGPATGCRRKSWQWLNGGHNQSSPLTILASSLSQAGHLASSRPFSPKSVVPVCRVQEALPADGTRVCPFIPETVPNQGRGRQVVGFSTASLAQDPDVAVARVLDLLAHPGPLGEARTACDVMEHKASPIILSTGGGVYDSTLHHPSLSSTAPKREALWQVCLAPFLARLCFFLVSRRFLWTLSPIFNPLLCIAPLPKCGNLPIVEGIGIK